MSWPLVNGKRSRRSRPVHQEHVETSPSRRKGMSIRGKGPGELKSWSPAESNPRSALVFPPLVSGQYEVGRAWNEEMI